MIVAFEGMDGVGKSTAASMFAEKTNFEHDPQRIMTILGITREMFDKLSYVCRISQNKLLSSFFYTFRCMLDNESEKDTVVERTMISTYYFEHNKIDPKFWDFFMSFDVVPELTFLLYASPETRFNRIKQRDPNDKDLKDQEALFDGYNIMLDFIYKYNIPYIGINTEIYNAEDIAVITSKIVQMYTHLNTPREKHDFIELMNNTYGFDVLVQEKGISRTRKK